MKISNASAQQIVEEIGKLVKQNINLMDHTGRIIASNDPGRIGQFHPGAHRIITERLQELYITQDMERSDPLVRRGINLPIEVDGRVVGAIGITGLYDEVIRYGQIVKKMAEILIAERASMDEQRLDLRVRTRFLEEWVLGEGQSNPQTLSERGFALGIDISLPRRCVVVSPRYLRSYTDSLEGQEFLERVEGVVCSLLPPGCIVLRNTGRQILLLSARSIQQLTQLCTALSEAVKKQLDVGLICGIDGAAADIHTACLQANRAWKLASHSTKNIVEFDAIHTELVLDQVSRDRKTEYLRRIFPGCNIHQVREFVALLEAWFAAEGSLNTAADLMFIHKNTIQYRLKRLAEVSGLDVRRPSQSTALYLAMQFFQELDADRDGLVM